jgi:6-phosphofructokinase 1
MREVKGAFLRGKPHFIIVAAEGASTPEKSVTQLITEYIEEAGHECRATVLGHVQRGGSPTSFDRLLGTRYGAAAVDALMAGATGVMIGLKGSEMLPVDLNEVLSGEPELNKQSLRLAEPLAH